LRLLTLLAGLALVPLALVAVLLALLQSQAVRDLAESAVDRFVPGVELAGLGAGLPARLEVARLALSDDAGVWLEVEGFALRWSPAALLGGLVDVERLTADRVRLARPPVGTSTPPPEPEPDGSAAPFELPDSIVPVRIRTLGVARIELGAPVLGEAAVFGLDGRVDAATGTAATLTLALERLDRERLTASVDARLDLAAATLALDVAAEERSGLLAALSGEPRLAPLTGALRGDGPLAAWDGRLEAGAGGLAELASDLRLEVTESLRAELEGTLTPRAGLAGASYAPLLSDGVRFAAAVRRHANDLVLESLNLDAGWLGVDGLGALRGEHAALDLAVELPRLAALQPLLGTEVAGTVGVDIALDGALPVPPGRVQLRARDLAIAGIDVAAIDQRVDLRAEADGAIGFEAGGTVEGVVVPAGDNVLEERIEIDARGRIVPGGPFELANLALAARTVTLEAAATGDLSTGTAAADARLRLPDLARFRAVADGAPAGAFELTLDADLRDGFSSGTVSVDGGGRDLGGLPPPAQALAGSAPTLAARAELLPNGELRLERLDLEGAAFTFAAGGAFAPASGRG